MRDVDACTGWLVDLLVDGRINHNEFDLARTIHEETPDSGFCFHPVRKLAATVGVSEATAHRALKKLRTLGCIERSGGPGSLGLRIRKPRIMNLEKRKSLQSPDKSPTLSRLQPTSVKNESATKITYIASPKATNTPPSHNELVTAARQYMSRGWSVIPLYGVLLGGSCSCGDAKCSSIGKHPACRSWKRLAGRPADEGELSQLFPPDEIRNIGIVTGAASGLVVVDFDSNEIPAGICLPPSPVVETGRGHHRYFTIPPGSRPRNRARINGDPIDVRGQDGFVMAPPSLHWSGSRYRWAEWLSPQDVDCSLAPDWLLEVTSSTQTRIRPSSSTTRLFRARLPDTFLRLLETSRETRGIWEGKIVPRHDNTRSGYDALLAAHLVSKGLSETEIADTLLCYPRGKAASEREHYLQRTVAKAIEYVRKREQTYKRDRAGGLEFHSRQIPPT